MRGLNLPSEATTRRLTYGLLDDFEKNVQSPVDIALDPLNWRVHDAPGTHIGAAGNDDLGVASTFGTDAPTVQAGDVGATSSTRYARQVIKLPDDYAPGSPLTLRALAAMLTTVADGSCTLDFQVYKIVGDGTIGSDLCSTAAQSMNSLTAANLDFVITPTGLQPGDQLDVRMAIAYVDSGDAGVMIPEVADVSLVYATTDGLWDHMGSIDGSDAVKGIRVITTGGSADDEAWMRSRQQVFKFQSGKPFHFQACVQFTEANTDDGVLAIGLTDQAGAALIQDGGLAIKSGNLDGALFLKFNGETFWRAFSSVDTDSQNTALNATDKNNLTRTAQTAGSSAYQVLEIEGFPLNDQYQIVYSIDGVEVARHIAIDISGGTEEMNVVFFVKAGGANAETLNVDYTQTYQKR